MSAPIELLRVHEVDLGRCAAALLALLDGPTCRAVAQEDETAAPADPRAAVEKEVADGTGRDHPARL
jgi:hypothetical protein